MLTPSNKSALKKLEPLIGRIAAINIGAVLCGARPGYLYDEYEIDGKRLTDEQFEEAAAAIERAFKHIKSVKRSGRRNVLFYDQRTVNKKDLAAWKKNSSLESSRALGRLLGFSGTAFPCSDFPDNVGVYIRFMHPTIHFTDRTLFQYCAHDTELFDAILAYKEFCSKAAPLKKVLGFDGFELSLTKMEKLSGNEMVGKGAVLH